MVGALLLRAATTSAKHSMVTTSALSVRLHVMVKVVMCLWVLLTLFMTTLSSQALA